MLEHREAVGVEEAAAASGISRSRLYELLAAGEGPRSFTIGRRRLIRVESLREWLEELEAADNGGVQAA